MTMTKIFSQHGLIVGALEACGYGFPTIHCCKYPCHQIVLNYETSLPKTHEHYFSYQEEDDLYLNLSDSALPLFYSRTFIDFFDFMDEQTARHGNIIIHCHEGASRAPTMAILWLARQGKIPNESFDAAVEACGIDLPNRGIQKYLRNNWDQVLLL